MSFAELSKIFKGPAGGCGLSEKMNTSRLAPDPNVLLGLEQTLFLAHQLGHSVSDGTYD